MVDLSNLELRNPVKISVGSLSGRPILLSLLLLHVPIVQFVSAHTETNLAET